MGWQLPHPGLNPGYHDPQTLHVVSVAWHLPLEEGFLITFCVPQLLTSELTLLTTISMPSQNHSPQLDHLLLLTSLAR